MEKWNGGSRDEILSLRVFPVSPNSFSLYLTTLQMGLRGLRIEEGARRILTGLSSLRGDLAAFREAFEVLGKHLLNAARNLEDARRKMEKVEWKLEQVESLDGEVVSEKSAGGTRPESLS
jgi:DNA anti-recombination protein RmuC